MTAQRGLSRRALLSGSALALVAIPPLTLIGLRAAKSPETIVADYLYRMLPGLAVPLPEVVAFADEYLSKPGNGLRQRAKLEWTLLLMEYPAFVDVVPAAMLTGYEWATRRMMTTFLFSTDFFTAAMTRPERTTFIAFADPYTVGCANPLSRKDSSV